MDRCFVPCCYYPTEVIFIDDEQSFLDTMGASLEEFSFKMFAKPKESIAFINQHLKTQKRLLDLYHIINHKNRHDLKVWQRLQNELLAALASKQHHHEFAIIICDYQMPGITGFELFDEINSKAFKRILLTGEADFIKAMAGFNKSLIDFYVRKDVDDIVEEVVQTVKRAEWDYFVSFNHLEIVDADPLAFITDAEFSLQLKKFFEQKGIAEFYLWNPIGDILAIDKKGEKHLISVRNQHALQEYASYMEQEYLDEPSEECKEAYERLKAHKEILLFQTQGHGLEAKALPIIQHFTTSKNQYYLAESKFK